MRCLYKLDGINGYMAEEDVEVLAGLFLTGFTENGAMIVFKRAETTIERVGGEVSCIVRFEVRSALTISGWAS